jgi:alanyl-tRNA synthetase
MTKTSTCGGKLSGYGDCISRLGENDNFWAMAIRSLRAMFEILFDQGEAIGCGRPECARVAIVTGISNSEPVFMQSTGRFSGN